jgi:hypothetical protein
VITPPPCASSPTTSKDCLPKPATEFSAGTALDFTVSQTQWRRHYDQNHVGGRAARQAEALALACAKTGVVKVQIDLT